MMAGLDFSALFKDEFDVLKFVWQTQHEIILKGLQSSNIIKKCDKKATELKDLANNEFSNRNYDLANNLYFTASMTAEYNSKLYGIVFANMSACFFEMKKWTITNTLIDVALNSAYPNDLRPKLYIRKIKAFIKKNDKVNAAKTATELENFLETSELSEDKKNTFLKLSSDAINTVGDENYFYLDLLLPDLEENPNFPNVTRKAHLCSDEKYGRHVIAKEVIKQGEGILIEKPYAVSGLVKCANCCTIIESSILPCKNCTSTIYCSESCMVDDEITHKWECKLFQNELLLKTDLKLRLAYRIFLKRIQAGYSINAQDNVDSGPDSFFNFTKLHKLALKDSIKTGIIFAAAYNCCVIMAQLYKDKHFMAWIKTKTKSHCDILMVGKALLHFVGICNCNAVGERIKKPNVEIHISWSFFNHSCVPNTVGSHIQGNMVLKALRTINPGEQIYISYVDPGIMSNSARKELLLVNWNIKCECKLCLTDQKDECDYKCSKCNSSNDTEVIKSTLKCNSCQNSTAIPLSQITELVIIMKGIPEVSANMNCELIYKIINIGNGFEVNPKANLGQAAYFEIVARKLKSGDLKDIEKYLHHMMNFNYIRSFQKRYLNIYGNLMNYTKSTYFSSSRFSPKLDMSTINCLLEFINYYQIFLNLYFPCKCFSKGTTDMIAFFKIQKEALQFQETIEWTE